MAHGNRLIYVNVRNLAPSSTAGKAVVTISCQLSQPDPNGFTGGDVDVEYADSLTDAEIDGLINDAAVEYVNLQSAIDGFPNDFTATNVRRIR